MPRPPADATGPAESPSRDVPDEAVSHSDVVETPEEVLAYWTPERMAQAQPREIRVPVADGEPGPEPEPEDN